MKYHSISGSGKSWVTERVFHLIKPETDDWIKALMMLARDAPHEDGSVMPMLLFARTLWHLRLKE